MRFVSSLLGGAFLMALAALPAEAQAPQAGQSPAPQAGQSPAPQAGQSPAPLAAQGCIGCHGPNGAGMGGVPGLAGRDQAELVAQMNAFRVNERPATIMGRVARGYTEAEIIASAAYFAQQPR